MIKKRNICKAVIEVRWEVYDKHAFHIYVNRVREGAFGYLKRDRYKLAEIDYFTDRTDEDLIRHLKLISPIVKQYAEHYEADIDWPSTISDFIKANDI